MVNKLARPRLLLLACAAVFGSVVLFAQAPKSADTAVSPAAAKASASEGAAPKAHDLNADDLGGFLDGLMPLEIENADIAGAVVAVVKDGKLVLAKGYGYADVQKKEPVSPETTLFYSALVFT
jgi:CubicO group peptidase (beta-lactamase class C family)